MADELPPNMKRALELGWIEKRGAIYYVVPYHREDLDKAWPGDTIYARCLKMIDPNDPAVWDTHDDPV